MSTTLTARRRFWAHTTPVDNPAEAQARVPRRHHGRSVMNHRSAIRDISAYLALVTGGSVAVALAFSHSTAAPALSAIVPVPVLLALTPILGRSTWRNLGIARSGLRRWPVAIAVPAAVAALAYGIGVLTGVIEKAAGSPAGWLLPMVFSVLIATGLVLSEEVGWRGFLLPRLQTVTSPRSAALVTGLAHALVHLPLILLTTTYNSHGSRWIIVPLTVVTITAAGVFYGWLRDSSGSTWPAVIAHSTGNALVGSLAVAANPARGASAAQLLGEGGVVPAVTMSAVAVLLLVRAGVWPPRTGAPGPDPRAVGPVLDPSGSLR